jgi:hypothetical protein
MARSTAFNRGEAEVSGISCGMVNYYMGNIPISNDIRKYMHHKV